MNFIKNIIFCLCIAFSEIIFSKPILNSPAPIISGKLLNGEIFNSSKLKNKVLLINFWASWCEPCREEMPLMETFYQKNKDNVEIIAISLDRPSDLGDVKKIAQKYSFPTATKDMVNFEEYGRIWRIPSTFIVDKNGFLVKDGQSGAPKIDQEFLDKFVKPLFSKN